MKRLAIPLAVALTACDPSAYSEQDQCFRTEIFIRCLQSIPDAADDVVRECANAADFQSLRMRKHIDEDCRA
ncbi:hypothetical protein ACW73L_07270 [Methylolobus aquaticus]